MVNINMRWFFHKITAAIICASLGACGGHGDDSKNDSVSHTENTLSPSLNLLAGEVQGLPPACAITGSTTTDRDGNIFAVAKYAILKITPKGVSTIFAGSTSDSGSTDGTGTDARFGGIQSIATDRDGNIYVADSNNHTIRKITPQRVVTTLAGSAGNSGSADGASSTARFHSPTGIAVDASGNVYVSSQSDNTIRKITPQGIVTTLAGSAGNMGFADGKGSAASFSFPMGIASDSMGNVFVADLINSTIRKITPQGVVTTFAGLANSRGLVDGKGNSAKFNSPRGVATDIDDNVYVADTSNTAIRKITPQGVVSTLAGTGTTSDVADGLGTAASFINPSDISTDVSGNVYVTDYVYHTIRKITPQGMVTTPVRSVGNHDSTDGAGGAARFSSPMGLTVDNRGNVYVADLGSNAIRKVTQQGVVTTFAGNAGATGQVLLDGIGSAATFNAPVGVSTDIHGNVYVAEVRTNTIRKVTPQGVVTTMSGSTAGEAGFTDGTGTSARFNSPMGTATDASGNVYVADTGNRSIRKITPQGVVTTLAGSPYNLGSTDGSGSAASFKSPVGISTDSSGNVYVVDSDNNNIRKITPQGVVTTLAGSAGTTGSADGTGAAARFDSPSNIATDTSGNLYVADTNNNTIRKITPRGVVTTVVGETSSVSVSLSPLPASLSSPIGVAIFNGNLYISTNNGIVWTKIP